MSRENRVAQPPSAVGVRSLDVQIKKIADKLQHLPSSAESGARESLTLNSLQVRELWEVWEMLRILTLRIRDLEAQQAARKAAVQS